ncbi:MAG: methylated-DNA--[protein]-cysteine S-methyltransferase [Pseudomonadota bacterium]
MTQTSAVRKQTRPQVKVRYAVLPSPVGDLVLSSDSETLQQIWFTQGKGAAKVEDRWQRDDAAFAEAQRQLSAYFAGDLNQFELELEPRGTAFQCAVWNALRAIPFGETRSYGELAQAIGRPKAVRAVGAANGANPLPIVVPCHRVIGANGTLTGFGGGLRAKQWLLAREGVQSDAFVFDQPSA